LTDPAYLVATSPIMAAQAPTPPPEQKMMVAIDESECSHYALEWALRNLAPRRLVLFTVQPFSPLSYTPAAVGSPRKPQCPTLLSFFSSQ
jgi:hypothetical protein